MDFSNHAGAASSFDTLPNGLLVFAILSVKGVKPTQTGGAYIDCELTVDQGQPHAGRKIFEKIGDPANPANGEKYRELGTIAVTRILECRGAGPHNMAGYKIDDYSQLNGARVGIKVGIETGTAGHNDKNRVAEWLTPNPASQSGNKGYARLVAGDHGVTATAAPVTGGFGNVNHVATPAASSGFGNVGGAAAATTGFQTAAAHAAETAASPSPAAGFAPTATSPSDPGATPGWLGQAQS